MARTKPLVCPLGARLLSQRIQQDPNFIMINNREPCEAEQSPKDYNRAPMPNGRSLLLDLPGEIRNRVYEILAASTPWSLEQDASEGGAAVWSNKTQRMKSKSGLICVSRLVNQEFCSLLSLHSPTLIFKVRNFDFSPVVRYLNKLSPRELKALPKAGITTRRKFRIVLEITAACPKNPDKLISWLLRVDHTKKTGYNVDFRYDATLSDDGRQAPDFGITGTSFPRSKSADIAFRVIHRYRCGILDELEPGRTRQEAHKIVRALHLAAFPVVRRRVLAAASTNVGLQTLFQSQS